MAWNEGLSDGFWGAVSTNVGQIIGAASGTTKSANEAQIAIANQNRNDQLQQTNYLQSLFASNSNSKLLPGQNNNQSLIIAAIVFVIIIGLALKRK